MTMWFFNRRDKACPEFEARFEELLEARETDPSAPPDAALGAHLTSCADCREAFELASAAGPLVREYALPVPESVGANPFFAARVGALIREHARRSSEFLPLLETASLRLMAGALTMGILLGALSASGVTRTNRPLAARYRPAEIRAISPEMNPAPANPDAVVIALLTSERRR